VNAAFSLKILVPMPIEFTCPNCRKLLCVAATAAGKRARCPDCSTVTEVPRTSSASSTAEDFPGFSPPESAAADNAPWSTNNWTSEPDSASNDSAANPFSAPESGYAGLHSLSIEEEARNQLAAPAMCLIVSGSIIFTLSALWVAMLLFTAIIDAVRIAQRDPFEAIFALVIVLGISVFALGRPALIIYGGIQMRKLDRYPFAITARILAIVSFCVCFVEMAFGIWALVVLSKSNVKQAFDEKKSQKFDLRQL
jgi:hypothetical protein